MGNKRVRIETQGTSINGVSQRVCVSLRELRTSGTRLIEVLVTYLRGIGKILTAVTPLSPAYCNVRYIVDVI